jgi:hypothetical protein
MIAVEPTFRFEECEKEQARGCENRERSRISGGHEGRDAVGECLDGGFERAKEPLRDCFAPEQLAPARMHEDIETVGGRRQRANRLRITVNDAIARNDQQRRVRTRRERCGGECDAVAVPFGRDDEP